MRHTLTRAALIDMKPCDLSERLALFGDADSLTTEQALAAGATVDDILWIAGRLRLTDGIVEFAERCATRAKGYATAAAVARYAARSADAAAVVAADAATAAADAARYAATAAARQTEQAAQIADLIELF
jgi:hypothetical protein